MAGADLANIKLFQASDHHLYMDQVQFKPLGPIHMLFGTIFMTNYRAIVDFGKLRAFFRLGGQYYVVPIAPSVPQPFLTLHN